MTLTVDVRGFRTIPQTAREWNNFWREQFPDAISGTIDLADLAPIATNTVIGRSTAGTGTPELIPATAAGRALLSGADAAAQRATLGIASGVYTPTLFNTTNIAASTAAQCNYLQIFDRVMVSGQVTIDPTAAAASLLGMSLPIASNLGATTDLAGTAAATTVTDNAIGIHADAANDRASFNWIAIDISNHVFDFSFLYRVI